MEIETIGIGGTIRLGQFLKYANIAESGAHAKRSLRRAWWRSMGSLRSAEGVNCTAVNSSRSATRCGSGSRSS